MDGMLVVWEGGGGSGLEKDGVDVDRETRSKRLLG